VAVLVGVVDGEDEGVARGLVLGLGSANGSMALSSRIQMAPIFPTASETVPLPVSLERKPKDNPKYPPVGKDSRNPP